MGLLPGRGRNQIAGPQRQPPIIDPVFTRAREDEEQLVYDVMAMERIGALARRQNDERAAKAGRANEGSRSRDPGHECIAIAVIGEAQILDVDDSGIRHVRCPS
jgi:hypothetical protein